jgi:hypothetical protein
MLVFVDDDNLLAPDYLERILGLRRRHPELGAIGAGRIVAEFAIAVTEEVRPFLPMLALREEPEAVRDSSLCFNRSIPYGAGLAILREPALQYVAAVRSSPLRQSLDRRGDRMFSGGDIDLALFACRAGFYSGVFPELSLTHLIPGFRLELSYLEKLAEGHASSHVFLAHLWGYDDPSRRKNPLRLWFSDRLKRLKMKPLAWRVLQARRRGETAARNHLAQFYKKNQVSDSAF